VKNISLKKVQWGLIPPIFFNRRRKIMEDITQKLQQLMKSGKVPKLIYKQSNQKKASLFVND
jgi:hypothetical protein